MKRYISLASAMMVGTVLTHEHKKPAYTSIAAAKQVGHVQTMAATVPLQAKARAVYVSENTTEHDLVSSVETSVAVQEVAEQSVASVDDVQVVNDVVSEQSASIVVRVNSATTANDPETSEGTDAAVSEQS